MDPARCGIYNMYTICIQYVYYMYTICIQYVYNMYTICIQYMLYYLYTIYAVLFRPSGALIPTVIQLFVSNSGNTKFGLIIVNTLYTTRLIPLLKAQ